MSSHSAAFLYLNRRFAIFLTFNGQYSQAQDLCSDDSAGTLTTLKREINVGTGILLHQLSQYIYEKEREITSVASQQSYELPVRAIRVNTVVYTSGSIPYVITEISDSYEWDRINETTATTSTYPEYYHVDKDKIHFFPTPSTDDDTITLSVEERFREMTLADYTTGTITTLAAAGTEVTGSSTAWSTVTNIRADGWFRVTNDGNWYQISSITDADTIVLKKGYEGIAISGGSDTYTIGVQALGAYEDLHILPVYYALSQFYARRRDKANEAKYLTLWNNGLAQANTTYANKNASDVIPSRRAVRYPYGRANQFPINVT